MTAGRKSGLFLFGTSKTKWDGLPALPSVEPDIQSVWQVCIRSRSGTGLISSKNSRRFCDVEARAIREEFEAFLNRLGPDSFAVFYFIGHGVQVAESELRLLCSDSLPESPQSAISPIEVVSMFAERQIAEWVMVLDCCHAGVILSNPSIQTRNRKNEGSLIVCAARAGQAWELRGKGGLLTHYLTTAIRSGACVPPGRKVVDFASAAHWTRIEIKEKHSSLNAIPDIDLWGSAGYIVARIPPPTSSENSLPVESVLFIGAAPENATEAIKQAVIGACHTLGRHLAECRVTLLICNPWDESADYHVAMGYAGDDRAGAVHLFMPEGEETKRNDDRFPNALDNDRIAVERNWYPVVGNGEFSPETWLYCQLQALEYSDAVVALGGAEGRSTSVLLQLAEARGVHVLPFAHWRGAAGAAYERNREHFEVLGIAESLLRRNGIEDLPDLIRAVALSRAGQPSDLRSVFLSRAAKDSAAAECVAEHLERRGIAAVFGDKPQAPGRDVSAVIHQRMRESQVCAIFWSQHFALSPHCFIELLEALRRARRENLHIWLLRLDSTPVVHPEARRQKSWYTPTMVDIEGWCGEVLPPLNAIRVSK